MIIQRLQFAKPLGMPVNVGGVLRHYHNQLPPGENETTIHGTLSSLAQIDPLWKPPRYFAKETSRNSRFALSREAIGRPFKITTNYWKYKPLEHSTRTSRLYIIKPEESSCFWSQDRKVDPDTSESYYSVLAL